MFNNPLGPDVRLSSTAGDPHAANVILYLPLTDAITTSPYNGQSIPAGGNLNDYGVNSLGSNYIGQDARALTATPSATGGSLAANTYYVRVIYYSASNAVVATTLETATTTTGSTSRIVYTWPSLGNISYLRVFVGTAPAAQTGYFQVSPGTTTTYTLSTLTGMTAGSPPVSQPVTSLVDLTSNSGTRTQKWARFSGGFGINNSTKRSAAIIFNHASFNNITNGTDDFTIEFNVKIVGDGQASGSGTNLKTFPFSFVGAAVNAVTASTSSPLNPAPGDGQGYSPGGTQSSGSVVAAVGDLLEMGVTMGSHTAPGGFGFGIGTADGSNRGYAAACTTNDTDPNSYVNRGFPAIPSGNTSTTAWGPYHFAVVRQAGVISIFLNGKKIRADVGADEGGDGTKDPSSTWNWDTFKLDSLASNGSTSEFGVSGNQASQHGLFIGGSYTYSSYGYDDDLYLQHFRVTQGVARYTADFTPETIYTVSP